MRFQARQNEMNYIHGRAYILNIHGTHKLHEIMYFETRYRNYDFLISYFSTQKLENKQNENIFSDLKL